MRQKDTEKIEAIKSLRKLLRPGNTVYTVLRHVSRSGMSREISLYICSKREIRSIAWLASKAVGYRRSERDSVKVSGCGMDMGFHVVYELGRVLWPKGFKLPKGKCGRNGDTSGFDCDGGYALNHRWL